SNQFIIKQIANQLQIPLNKVPINIEQFGNTSGVSLGLLLTQQSMVSPETHTSVFSGYGAGLSWGNVILNFDEHFKALPLIEY
ncbi:MAG: ketoacyl-ACP synthase III, partial [Flavobacteriales bacterium]